jgi:hypothetical protein
MTIAGDPAAAPRSDTNAVDMRESLKSLATLVVSFLLCLAVAEGVLRMLPVCTDLEMQAIDASNPVLRHRPNSEFVFSDGFWLTNANRGHINNFGFVNDQDYDTDDPRPLLAVIGDSYVEALMIPYGLTVQGRLDAREAGRRRVYSFGSSGSSLLDYLYYAAYARQHFRPEWVVINVVGNDFDEMLLRYRQEPAFHHLKELPDGSLAAIPLEYRLSPGLGLLRRSALARYLSFNIGNASPAMARLLGALHRVAAWLFAPANAAEPEFVGNTAATTDPQRIELSQRAVRYVLDHLAKATGLPPSHVLFLVDSYRIFDPAGLASARRSFFGIMREFLIAEARGRGYEVVDLQDWFARRHEQDGSVFQFPDDGHWNVTGHDEAARAVIASRVYNRFAAR